MGDSNNTKSKTLLVVLPIILGLIAIFVYFYSQSSGEKINTAPKAVELLNTADPILNDKGGSQETDTGIVVTPLPNTSDLLNQGEGLSPEECQAQSGSCVYASYNCGEIGKTKIGTCKGKRSMSMEQMTNEMEGQSMEGMPADHFLLPVECCK